MMLEGQFPIESQVGLSGIIASNSAKLANANFGGITTLVWQAGVNANFRALSPKNPYK